MTEIRPVSYSLNMEPLHSIMVNKTPTNIQSNEDYNAFDSKPYLSDPKPAFNEPATHVFSSDHFEIDRLMSSKYIAHLFGDSFIEGSNLEGWYTEDALMHMILVLKENNEVGKFDDFIQKLEDALALQGEISQIRIRWDCESRQAVEVKELSEQIIKKVQALEAGQSVLIPGGSLRHVVLYEIKREPGGSFQFSVYNTGAGVERHWLLPERENQIIRVQGVYKIHSISKERMCFPLFLEKLLKFEVMDNVYWMEFSEELYDELLPQLDGVRERLPSDPNQFMTPQRSGTCTWKAICAYLRYNMPSLSDYKQLLLRARSQVFNKLYSINYAIDYKKVLEQLMYKLLYLPKEDYTLYYTKEEIITISIMKMEKHLSRYDYLLSEKERDRIYDILLELRGDLCPTCGFNEDKIPLIAV